jgi:hypothetical protein
MKVIRYVDVYAGQQPEHVWFRSADQCAEQPRVGLKRYRIEMDIPDVEPEKVEPFVVVPTVTAT